ncbi:Sodium/glucose cotransporter [Maioricimonas rarisocia]|uniref:Sodium/glucose cotransporter n=1 Tax=Maioricimonas rarisocia TaxID=2528026 RepID=A0A517Z3W3_9PLAN|nr:sodium:solute symporter family protein [Maioricimonas rarisocia]QDU37184.1 Sodium/glucose cotransporter [Maioricimonas rarisocia]
MNEAAAAALSQTNFTTLDTVIVVVYLSVSLVIGVMVNRFAGSMENYIGAGRKVGPWLGVATMTGTELGLVTVMYSAQKGFTGGFAAFHMAVIAGVATLFVGLTGFIVGPLRRMEVLTIPEFYEKRFNRKIRILGGIILVLAGVLNMGLFLKAGSMFIVGVTGMASEGAALKWVMVGLLTLVLSYTTLGGMISVVLTDYVQFVVLSFGLLLATGIAVVSLGWTHIFETVHQQLGVAGFDPTVEGAGFGWSYVFWMLITAGFVGSAVWPTAVARALAMESEQAVRRQYCLSSISFAVRFIIPYFWGICALVFITGSGAGADLEPLFFPADGGPAPLNNLYAMPVFMGRLLPPILLGIVTAGMIAAFMSTHDSYFLAWSSVITQDIVAPLRREPMPTAARVRLTRILIVLMGGYVLYWSLFYKGREDIWDYMAVTGGIYFTGAFVILMLGIYWKQTSSFGALLGLLSGLLMLFGLEPIQIASGLKYQTADGQWIERLTSPQIGLLTVGIAIVLTVAGSLIRPDRAAEPESSAGESGA